jgi:uncharacterized protein YcbK (DUF882 family)
MSNGYPPNFTPEEFFCKCDGHFCDGPPIHPARTRHLAWVCQMIRDEIGAPMRVNSGYRCPDYNKKIGGASQSLHVKGMAADLACDAVPAEEVADTIEGLMKQHLIPNGGLGRYNTFTHVDIRHTPARWSG